jgi:hypothetical protein
VVILAGIPVTAVSLHVKLTSGKAVWVLKEKIDDLFIILDFLKLCHSESVEELLSRLELVKPITDLLLHFGLLPVLLDKIGDVVCLWVFFEIV